jgi:hypothetical protein
MKTARYNKSEIFKQAWMFFRQTGISFAECLKKAWDNFKLVLKMKSGIVMFRFIKVSDGTIRQAFGTLQESVIADKIKGDDNRAKNPTIQTYFDTEKQAFRSFKKFNLV